MPEDDLVARPGARDAGIDPEPGAAQAEAQDPLDAGLVHPTRRPRVPGPAAAADVGRLGVDVGGHDVRLDLVAMDAGAGAGVVDRVKDREEVVGLVTAAPGG